MITKRKMNEANNKQRYFEGEIKLTENSLTLFSQSIMILKYIIIRKEKDGIEWIL